jgi:demethylmacrocin O-methyltransferase
MNYRDTNADPLSELAVKHKTDKWGSHFYTQHYHKHFAHLRDARINILEIGIGGYDDPQKGGESLRMWQDYFPNARIYGIDIADKSAHDTDRIKTFQGSQIDFPFLDKVVDSIGRVDIIIDDGSHINSHAIDSFKYLFPKLDPNGIYVVEDLQTSYWESYGGSSFCLDRSRTSVNFFKHLVDCLNHQEMINPRYRKSYFDQNITGISWYHGMVFIQKGANDEESNIIKNNRHLGQAESFLGYYRRRLNSMLTGLLPPRW